MTSGGKEPLSFGAVNRNLPPLCNTPEIVLINLRWTSASSRKGDVGYVQQSIPHYIENTGDEDLRFLRCSRPAATKTGPFPSGCPMRHLSW
jgi:hypothetical protein